MMKTSVRRFGRTARYLLATALVAMVAVPPAAVRAVSNRDDQDDHRADQDDHGRRDDGRDWDDFRFREPEKEIRHVVVIFQENVSFDHYFATYPHAANTDGTTFVAKAGTPLVNGLFAGGLLDHNPNSAQPFRLSSSQAATCDQGHGYLQEQQRTTPGR